MILDATRPPPAVSDRRRVRSDIPAEAIALLLEATAERSSLRGIALSNAEGVALAGSGDIDADELAMLGTQRAISGSFSAIGLGMLERGEALFTASIDVEGTPFILSAIGKSEPDALHVFAAVERILSLPDRRADRGAVASPRQDRIVDPVEEQSLLHNTKIFRKGAKEQRIKVGFWQISFLFDPLILCLFALTSCSLFW